VLAVWRLFAPFLRSNNAGVMLLVTRLLNAVVFAGAVALFVFFVASCTPTQWPALDVWPFFIIPTLPSFGTQVSNYAPLCAAYIVFAASVMLLLWGGPRSYVAGALMGVSFAASVVLSRSALTLAPVLIACAAVRIAIRPQETSIRVALTFWTGLILPCVAALLAIPPPAKNLISAAGQSLPAVLRPITVLIGHPWILMPIGAAGATAELWVQRRGHTSDSGSGQLSADVVSRLAYAAAAVVAASILLSAFVLYPSAPTLDARHVQPIRRYVAGMLFAGATPFRMRHTDFLTSQSFWSGFGWLDTPLPDWSVATLATGSGVGLVLTLIWIARARSYKTGITLFVLLAALLVAFAAAAFSVVSSTPADLHGRYLLGIYSCLIPVCWHFLPRVMDKLPPAGRAAVIAFCGLCVICIHSLAFATILRRYFG
jgi:hypothetical protein